MWPIIPMQLIGVTRHCTLGNCEPIVLIDESVPEGHDLIASLGSRKGVENTPYTEPI